MDLKEFWDDTIKDGLGKENVFSRRELFPQLAYDLGLFFWERGGKQFAKDVLEHENTMEGKLNDFPYLISEAEFYTDGKFEDTTGTSINSKTVLQARDFLDCLACLGEERIKELIKELK